MWGLTTGLRCSRRHTQYIRALSRCQEILAAYLLKIRYRNPENTARLQHTKTFTHKELCIASLQVLRGGHGDVLLEGSSNQRTVMLPVLEGETTVLDVAWEDHTRELILEHPKGAAPKRAFGDKEPKRKTERPNWKVMDADGKVAGMTTYMNVDAGNRRVEIGSTWYTKRVQRTPLNTQCKLLLLAHAFDVCLRSFGKQTIWLLPSTA